MTTKDDQDWMRTALEAAQQAAASDEVPVGACVVGANGELLSVAFNLTITNNDPTAHAEILALRTAAARIDNYRLVGATLYTTIEPCVMCAGAVVNARVTRLVFGAHDLRYGGVESVFRLCDSPLLNHRVDISTGVLQEDCSKLMKDFFAEKRAAGSLSEQFEGLT
jgi:tRNA(adenine34) deaminase